METSRSPYLPLLLGVVAALLLWTLADDYRGKLTALQQQLETGARLAQRHPEQTIEMARAEATAARQQRAAVEARLQSSESAQMVRARLAQDLRVRCLTTGALPCAVRLSEETRAPEPSRPAGVPASGPGNSPFIDNTRRTTPASLESLGIAKSRAVVSGSFQRDELVSFSQALMGDDKAYWRINGVTVRGTSFELDVERQLWQTASAPNPASAASAGGKP